MKFPFSNSSVDEFGPLRELRSPLTTSAIRERVLERMASPPMWGQFRNILAEFLVVGVAGAALLKMAGPAVQHDLPYETHGSHGTGQISPVATNVGSHGIGPIHLTATHRRQASAISSDASAISSDASAISSDASGLLSSQNDLAAKPITISNNRVISSPVISYPTSFSLHPSSLILHPSPIWFASASGGAIFSQIRMMGERGELGFEDGWKTIELSFTTGDGSRDLRDEIAHHSGMTAPLLSKERVQEFSFLFGATAQAGPIELRAMAGPAYLSSSSAYYSLSTGVTGTPVSLQSFGAAAEISALYPINSSFAAGIDGMANYHMRQFTGGVFASIEFQFGP